ncbi:MAG: arginine N-succinyltransferase [Myxococcota bacterium]
MFLVREALPSDLDGVFEVARHLDTVNLPADREVLRETLEASRRSFAAEIALSKRQYLLVIEDVEARRIAGTSMIYAQHGQRGKPHIFFEVLTEERYSDTLDRHFVHKVLHLGLSYNGPTEIGGLAVLPAYRGHDEKVGLTISYARFLFIAAHREWFRDDVISELLPPLEKDGTSRLWEALGRKFTGLSYQEADRISHENKEFIRGLFPAAPIYATLLPDDAQALIGVVGPATRGVEKMLRRIGFTYANRIDPFDGGPHFVARTDDLSLVRATVRRPLAGPPKAGRRERALVATEPRRGGDEARFRACATECRIDGEAVQIPEAARALLGVAEGEELWVTPLREVEGRRPKGEGRDGRDGRDGKDGDEGRGRT